MRIGIFGGSFDPVHLGHVRLAGKMLKSSSLQKIYFVPVRRSPFKSKAPSASAAHRLSMLRLALRGKPRMEISRCELRRPPPSYTAHTVKFFRKKFPRAELFLVMGRDALRHFGKWRNAAEIRKECGLLPHARIGGISSTDIRARAQSGRGLKGLVHPAVERFVRRKGLYRA